jgi:hypothetical protein
MNQEDINRMAVEAWGRGHEIFYCNDDGIDKFAKLIAEACAKVCEVEASVIVTNASEQFQEGRAMGAVVCAEAIRARMK